jgi:hypothetical protein
MKENKVAALVGRKLTRKVELVRYLVIDVRSTAFILRSKDEINGKGA